MTLNCWIKTLLMDELRWRTNLSDSIIGVIAEGFAERLNSTRHTIVPTYLSDEMFEAQKAEVGDIEFSISSALYRAAINEYRRHDKVIPAEEEPGSFW